MTGIGYVERQLILRLDAQDRPGASAKFRAGPQFLAVVGSWAGPVGRRSAKQPQDSDGRSPVSLWRASPELLDRRLAPKQREGNLYVFGEQAVEHSPGADVGPSARVPRRARRTTLPPLALPGRARAGGSVCTAETKPDSAAAKS